MDALAPVSTWTSEDDGLLKNAIEAGASLESISEGAIQFSQKFTFQELKDRWHSLTCHANVSVEPSSHDIECVNSASTQLPKPISEYKGEKYVHKRWMNDGAPDCFNPMLKRVKSNVVENGDNPQSKDNMYGEAKLNHLGSPVSNCESELQHLPYLETAAASPVNVTKSGQFEVDKHSMTQEVDHPSEMLTFQIYDPFYSEAETSFTFDELCFPNADNDVSTVGGSSTLHQIPVEDIYKSISELTLPEHQVEEKESAANFADSHSARYLNNLKLSCDVHSDAMDQILCHHMDNMGPRTDGNLAGSSGSSMDLREVEDLLFTDEGNDTDSILDLDSFLLDFDGEETSADIEDLEQYSTPGGGACSGELGNDGQYKNCSSKFPLLTLVPDANLELPTCISDIHVFPSVPAASNAEIPIACAPEAHLSVPAVNSKEHISCAPEAQILPPKTKVDSNLPELCNGVICCVLNTEDTKIPCNDDTLITPTVLNTEDTEIPCNDDTLITLPTRRRTRTNHQLRGVRAMYLIEALKGKPRSPEMIQTKKELHVAENNKEKPEPSGTIQS